MLPGLICQQKLLRSGCLASVMVVYSQQINAITISRTSASFRGYFIYRRFGFGFYVN